MDCTYRNHLSPRGHLKRWQWRMERFRRWVRANPGWCLLVVFCCAIVVMLAGVWREL